MSSIVEAARDLMAVMSPATGTRATGKATVKATGADVDLYHGTYAVPRMGGNYRDDLVVKVGPGPNKGANSRTYWTVTSTGTVVDFLSNIGGVRHNKIAVPASGQVDLVFDPPIDGIASSVLSTSFSGGADPSDTDLGAVYDMFMYQQFEGDLGDLARSNMVRLPSVLVVWKGSTQIDGSSTSYETYARVSKTQSLNRESFDIIIFVDRAESDHLRRLQGMYIMDRLTSYLTNRVDYDGRVVGQLGGVHVENRSIQAIRDVDGYVSVYMYALSVSIASVYTMYDERSFTALETFVLDIVKPFPAAEGGDIAVVGDGSPGTPGVEIDNT